MTITATRRYATQQTATPSMRSYTEVYRCETDSPSTDGPVQVRQSLPSLGSVFSDDPFAFVTGYGTISPVSFEQGILCVYDAVVNYSTVPDKNAGDCSTSLDSPPWLRPARISGGGTEERLGVSGEEDNNGRKMVNSAGYPFENLTVWNGHPYLFIERDYEAAAFDLATLWSFTFAVNSQQFFGLLPRSWLLFPPKWRRQAIGGQANCQEYYTVLYTFKADFRGWDLRPIDEGTLSSDGVPFKAGEVVLDGVWGLDGQGNWLNPGDDPVIFDGLAGHPQPFKYYPEEDFAAGLGIPGSL